MRDSKLSLYPTYEVLKHIKQYEDRKYITGLYPTYEVLKPDTALGIVDNYSAYILPMRY